MDSSAPKKVAFTVGLVALEYLVALLLGHAAAVVLGVVVLATFGYVYWPHISALLAYQHPPSIIRSDVASRRNKRSRKWQLTERAALEKAHEKIAELEDRHKTLEEVTKRVEASLAPRRLDSRQKNDLLKRLSAYSGRSVSLLYVDPESESFASDLA